jgi:hypothetical protein
MLLLIIMLLQEHPTGTASKVEYQPLWQHPSTTSSESFILFEIDMKSVPTTKDSYKVIQLSCKANAVVFWCEWMFGESEVLSTGLLNQPAIGEQPIWHSYQQQAVIFAESQWENNVQFSARFDPNTLWSSPIQFLSVK